MIRGRVDHLKVARYQILLRHRTLVFTSLWDETSKKRRRFGFLAYNTTRKYALFGVREQLTGDRTPVGTSGLKVR
jgi:hypothetical protein